MSNKGSVCGVCAFVALPSEEEPFWDKLSVVNTENTSSETHKQPAARVHTLLKLSIHNLCNSEKLFTDYTHLHTQLHHPAPITTAVTSHVWVSDSHKMDKKKLVLESRLPITLHRAPRADNAAGEKLDGALSQLGRCTMEPCGIGWNGCEPECQDRTHQKGFSR